MVYEKCIIGTDKGKIMK